MNKTEHKRFNFTNRLILIKYENGSYNAYYSDTHEFIASKTKRKDLINYLHLRPSERRPFDMVKHLR